MTDLRLLSKIQLDALMLQYRKNIRPPTCEAGHLGCGATNTQRDGAPCSEAIGLELKRRNAK